MNNPSLSQPMDMGDDTARIAAAARILNRPVGYVDDRGYHNEIIAASPVEPGGLLAYVTCIEKQLDRFVDVSIDFRLRSDESSEIVSPLECYNPYFGCTVSFLEWFGEIAVLIYREKHETYVATGTLHSPAHYQEIGHAWIINGNHLGYWNSRQTHIQRVTLPQLTPLEPLTEAKAIELGICPRKHW